MKLTISKDAAQWYKDELEMDDNTYVRFYVRYGGSGGLIPGFSLGVNTDTPQLLHTSIEVNNVTFYIEESDAWYFEDKNLNVDFDYNNSEPTFSYE